MVNVVIHEFTMLIARIEIQLSAKQQYNSKNIKLLKNCSSKRQCWHGASAKIFITAWNTAPPESLNNIGFNLEVLTHLCEIQLMGMRTFHQNHINIGVSSKWVNFHFWATYPYKFTGELVLSGSILDQKLKSYFEIFIICFLLSTSKGIEGTTVTRNDNSQKHFMHFPPHFGHISLFT